MEPLTIAVACEIAYTAVRCGPLRTTADHCGPLRTAAEHYGPLRTLLVDLLTGGLTYCSGNGELSLEEMYSGLMPAFSRCVETW